MTDSAGTSSSILKITNVDPKEAGSFPKVKHPNLPQHPFSLLLVAPKGGGKTNLICNLILKQYKGYFHRVVVCSPTLENDPKWELVKETKHVVAQNKKLDHIMNGTQSKGNKTWKIVDPEPKERKEKFEGYVYENDFFSDQTGIFPIIEEQKTVIEYLRDNDHSKDAKFIIDRILIVLDDQAGLFRMSNNQNPMVNFVLKHRHYSTSIIIVTQAYKAIPKSIRTNMNALILFEIPNQAELDVIYEEYPDRLTFDEWMSLYWHIIESKPYAFFYMNNHFPAGQRIFACFDRKYIVSVKRSHKRGLTFDQSPDSKRAK